MTTDLPPDLALFEALFALPVKPPIVAITKDGRVYRVIEDDDGLLCGSCIATEMQGGKERPDRPLRMGVAFCRTCRARFEYDSVREYDRFCRPPAITAFHYPNEEERESRERYRRDGKRDVYEPRRVRVRLSQVAKKTARLELEEWSGQEQTE